MSSLSDIAFAQIKDNYHRGQYGEFKVIMDISTGYINATHLCGLAENKDGIRKELFNWRKNTTSNELINEISSSLGTPADDLLRIVSGGQIIEIRGTYAHPDLIPHIASWASPKFAVKVSRIVNAYLVREYKESLRVKDQQIDRLEQKIDAQSTQISAQSAKIDQLLKEIEYSREENSHVMDQLDIITEELENVSVDNNDLSHKVTAIETKLDIATDQRVPPAKSHNFNEVFAIYHNPKSTQSYMLRRQKRALLAGINNCNKLGYTTEIFYSDSPNAINLGIRLKNKLPRSLGAVSGTIITLTKGKTADDLIQYVRKVEAEKKQI
jgi:regulator of replication initiation timing